MALALVLALAWAAQVAGARVLSGEPAPAPGTRRAAAYAGAVEGVVDELPEGARVVASARHGKAKGAGRHNGTHPHHGPHAPNGTAHGGKGHGKGHGKGKGGKRAAGAAAKPAFDGEPEVTWVPFSSRSFEDCFETCQDQGYEWLPIGGGTTDDYGTTTYDESACLVRQGAKTFIGQATPSSASGKYTCYFNNGAKNLFTNKNFLCGCSSGCSDAADYPVYDYDLSDYPDYGATASCEEETFWGVSGCSRNCKTGCVCRVFDEEYGSYAIGYTSSRADRRGLICRTAIGAIEADDYMTFCMP
ncbi:hypothetical protein HT031_004776 [Scenedesmus sp. PABB004]|nr:hypothetical protein HT031_004776 [Scenedesmus sp. PABB004]